VCVDYKDLSVLQEEAEEGRRLGFDGKVGSTRVLGGVFNVLCALTSGQQQAIHPSQVETIRKAFAPSSDGEYIPFPL
jgi:hypothetical protein